jgi:hypothetical protein
MKSPFATMALVGSLAAGIALSPTFLFAQQPGVTQSGQPRSPFGDTVGAGAPGAPGADRNALNGNDVPSLTPASDLKAPQMDLPDEPVEPYLLTKDNGPFMVLARVFRGPDSQRMAIALVKELRADFGLPAYIFRKKENPGGSLIRGMPPTAPSQITTTNVKMPERIRTFDEAAVLVGNVKTQADQERLWREVKKLEPQCLEKMSSPFSWRKGLSSAIRTTNPYIPAQNLYPRTTDKLMVMMNGGLRSIVNCPGPFSLQVAEFTGRSGFTFNPNAPANQILGSLKDSPLRTAHDDAERMAEKLANAPEIRQTGQPVYVYHDHTSSKVYVGSFNSPQDPAAGALRNYLVQNAYNLSNKNFELPNKRPRGRSAATDTMIVPALALTDVNDLKGKIRN